jgi:hypothetical protein
MVLLVIALSFIVPVEASENLTAITLKGNDIFYYNITTFPSPVILFDNATLIINDLDSQIVFYNHDTVSMDIESYNNTRIIVSDSSFPGSFHINGNSMISVSNSTVFMSWWCSPPHGFHNGSGVFASDYGSIEVLNSKICLVRLEEYAQASFQNSILEMIQGRNTVKSSFELQSCEIGRLRLYDPVEDLNGVRKGNIVNRKFTQQPGITFNFFNTRLKDGLEVCIEDSDRAFTLCDFYLLSLFNGTNAKVTNSSIWASSVYDSSLDMVGCNVDYLNVMEGSDIKLEKCLIERLDPSYSLNLVSKNTQIEQYYLTTRNNMTLENTNLTISKENFWELNITGSFNIINSTLPLMSAYPHNVRIKRTYPVTITSDQKPVEDAKVILTKKGQIIGEYESNEVGYTEFDIIYEDIYNVHDVFDYVYGNLTDTYKLTVISSGQNETRTIDIYTLTPIRVDFKPRINHYIYYITLIAAIALVCLTINLKNSDEYELIKNSLVVYLFVKDGFSFFGVNVLLRVFVQSNMGGL